jgi:hypothetical protein
VALCQLFFSILLLVESKRTAFIDALSADRKTFINLNQGSLCTFKTVHAASGTFVIHNVELFVQESKED